MNIQLRNPLHLYRSLLRETTYLFDHNARIWTEKYIKSSFRDKAPRVQHGKTPRTVVYKPTQTPSLDERHQLKRGRKFLVLLQRANQGYPRQLRNLLQLVYGRKGRQKRVLTAPLLQPDVPESKAAWTEKRSPVKFSKDWKAPEDFLSVLHVQNQLSSYLSVRRQLRTKPYIEEKNRWGRPMPHSRVKNITQKWYARMAAAFMPPVPEDEWERLKAIAMGTEQFKPIPRRAAAKRPGEGEEFDSAELLANTVISGVAGPITRKIQRSIKNPHHLTCRYVSRIYARHILNHTPVAKPNPIGKGLVSKWDDGKRDVIPPARPRDRTQIDALFG